MGLSAASSASATIASWVFTALSKLVLPIAAVGLLAIVRIQEQELDSLALIAFVVVAVGAIVVALVPRSPKIADWMGGALGTVVGWIAGLFQRDVATDFRELLHEFRTQAADVLTQRTHFGLLAGLAARLAGFFVLLGAVRAVGIGQDEVSWVVIFAAFSTVMAIGVIPIFNLPGITEVILIGTLTRYAPDGFNDEIAAAVFVYRSLTWLLPIPLVALRSIAGATRFARPVGMIFCRNSTRAATTTDLRARPQTPAGSSSTSVPSCA